MTKLMELIECYRTAGCKAEHNAYKEAVVAEVERLKKDAARYRWLREYLPSDDTSCDEAIVAALTPEELDAAIDAALENTNEDQSI